MRLLNLFVICACFLEFIPFISLGYIIGTGIYDITGPINEINLMGYAMPEQIGSGLHLRLFSRAFIFKETPSSKPICFVNLDAGMSSQLLKTKVIMVLSTFFGDTFNHQNLMISATHTHSGPAGYFQYALFDITSRGFVKSTFEAMADGIVQSIRIAHRSMTKGHIFVAYGDVEDCSINRSPLSYLQNPFVERSMYSSNVDKKMTLLKFVSDDGRELGMINWFAVHGTSMNNTNKLVSSDNKGLAAVLFEHWKNGDQTLGHGPFVAAFAQSNEGDVSPNTRGARCVDTGEACDPLTSTCNGRVQMCIAFGPGRDMFESTKTIAEKQFEQAKELYEQANIELETKVGFRHQFVNMTDIPVEWNSGNDSISHMVGRTCKPAMGYSFAAGTTDGPGISDFRQGMLNGTPFWDFVSGLISRPTQELKNCHAPKPILLATGQLTFPVPWQPSIVETQIFQLGQVLIVGLPGEFTTMSGRRIVRAVKEAFSDTNKLEVILAGLANVYSDYVATFEEYQLQRYEGASTIYGPHTLGAYVAEYTKLAESLAKDTSLPPGPQPPFLLDKLYGFIFPPLFDWHPINSPFGTVRLQPRSTYYSRNDTVVVSFVTANPRHNLRLNGTFLTIEIFDAGAWKVKFTDANWETIFILRKFRSYLGFVSREAEIRWAVSSVNDICVPGTYIIRHFGTALTPFGGRYDFSGETTPFEVICGV